MEALRNTIIVLSKLVESWALFWHPDPTNSAAEIIKLLALFKVAFTQNLEIALLYRAQHPSTPTAPPRNTLPKDCVAGNEANVAPPLFSY